MPNKSSAKTNFVVQASILAMAGIISRVIGLLYKSPLHSVIGDLGLGYYQSAYAYYTIILLISSYSIPSAISKVIAQKLAVREYNNAHRIFKCALAYVLVVGGVASMFLYFGAGLFVEKDAIPVLRMFAPTILLYGILGVLRGYFQAHNSMIQTSVSQIFEQIVNAVVSIVAAKIMITVMMGSTSNLDAAGENSKAIYGAMGSAIGTGMGVVFGLLFMLFVYHINKKLIKKRIRKDVNHQVDDYRSILKSITLVVTPFILSTAIYNLSASVNTKLFTDFYVDWSSMKSVDITAIWGVFSGQALTISNIPIAFASAMASAMIPSIATLIAAKDNEGAKKKIGIAVKVTMLISIPCAAGMLVLAEPITDLLFHNTEESLILAGKLLMALSLSVIFYALSTLNSSILQGLGKVNTPIYNAGIALAAQTIIAVILLEFTGLGIYSIAVANTVYSGLMCIMNQYCVRRALGYKQEIVKTFIIPGVAAAVMGGIIWLIYQGLFSVTGSMKISVIPSILVGIGVYFVALILFKGVTEEELQSIPKGGIILRVAKRIKLM